MNLSRFNSFISRPDGVANVKLPYLLLFELYNKFVFFCTSVVFVKQLSNLPGNFNVAAFFSLRFVFSPLLDTRSGIYYRCISGCVSCL